MYAVFVAFIASGFGFASWASRIPQVRDVLHVRPAQLGLILLAVAVGSIIALPVAGIVVTRLGTARSIAVMSLILAVGLATIGVGVRFGAVPVAVGLFLLGFGNGTWDVAMNVEGAAVEQRLGRSIMSRFHAGWSVGTVAGALLGSAAAALHIPVTAHMLAVAVMVAVAVPYAVRSFLPAQQRTEQHADRDGPARRHPLLAWTEPRTVLIGVFVLTMAFTEGTGNDWLGVAVIDGYGAPPAVGSLGFAVFVAAMTVGRWYGPGVLDRYGRTPVLRISALTALGGLALFVFGPGLGTAMAGAVLWGLGTALGFPVGMSAAADDPARAAARVSVVASIGYVAFLAGPPLIGLLGNRYGVLHSLTVVAGLLAVGLLTAGACRPLPGVENGPMSDQPDGRRSVANDQQPGSLSG
jgi:fucose permease